MEQNKNIIDNIALNEAAWEFITLWTNEDKFPVLPAFVFNNIKPLLEKVIIAYIKSVTEGGRL